MDDSLRTSSHTQSRPRHSMPTWIRCVKAGILCFLVVVGLLSLTSVRVGSQSIRVVRSDVDSGRSSFVTATQLFGMDIEVSGVKNCTGVSFELQYNGAQYIVFSDWKARQLGPKGTFAYDLSDTATGKGSLHVGALSGTAVTDPGVDNPIAVHLDFVVRPSAPNALPVSFNFVHAQAVTSDSGGMIVQLSGVPYNVSIHGFVKVWPGDADNNGVVDSRDATTVGAFLKQGSGASNVRGYKREPASTLWLAQEALVWDSLKATYADCDGSGDVTLSDNLVVQINFGSLHSTMKHDNDIQSLRTPRFAASLERQNISISSPRPLAAAAFELHYAPGTALPVGFESDDDQVYCSLFLPDEDQKRLFLVFGSTNATNILHSGVVGRLVYANSPSSPTCTQALGSTASGTMVQLGLLSAVESDPNESISHSISASDISINSEQIHLSCGAAAELQIIDLLGREVLRAERSEGSSLDVSLPQLPIGIYAVVLRSGNELCSRTFQHAR